MASTRGGQAWRCLLAGLLVMAAQANPTAGSAQETRIRVQDGQSLRDIAQAELGDPDLWTEILRANELRSPADVQPGMELVIPAGAIAAADRALDQALAAIQRATAEGARLFAPDEIEQGIASYDAGVAR
ncbi:LysM peptidoglycan-binding domain-containing protein, partial [Geminicoccus harenae]